MALKIVFLALLVYCAASEAQSQGDDTSLPLSYNVTELQGDGSTCPNDQLQQETKQNVTIAVRNLLDKTNLARCPCLFDRGTRIANLDMSDPNQQCPQGLTLITSPVRSCGRISNESATCDSAMFPIPETKRIYSRVCGRVRAYQVGRTNAFRGFNRGEQTTLDAAYVNGISITHGSNPRQHVWTFAAAQHESYSGTDPWICACTNTDHPNPELFQVPPFVGNDYFCDTGATTNPRRSQSFPDDPLWDGEGCGPTNTCCELNNPPWFCKQLPTPTSDDIEVRSCFIDDIRNENILIDQIELYIF